MPFMLYRLVPLCALVPSCLPTRAQALFALSLLLQHCLPPQHYFQTMCVSNHTWSHQARIKGQRCQWLIDFSLTVSHQTSGMGLCCRPLTPTQGQNSGQRLRFPKCPLVFPCHLKQVTPVGIALLGSSWQAGRQDGPNFKAHLCPYNIYIIRNRRKSTPGLH